MMYYFKIQRHIFIFVQLPSHLLFLEWNRKLRAGGGKFQNVGCVLEWILIIVRFCIVVFLQNSKNSVIFAWWKNYNKFSEQPVLWNNSTQFVLNNNTVTLWIFVISFFSLKFFLLFTQMFKAVPFTVHLLTVLFTLKSFLWNFQL